MKNKEYMTIKEASEYLGVDRTTLRRWDKAGKLSPLRHPSNNYRIYSKKDIEKFITTNAYISFDELIQMMSDICVDLTPKIEFNLRIILRKIVSNLESANVLLENDYINEAFIILRSAIESVVLFCYIMNHKEYLKGFEEDSQLQGFKNDFITYKEYKESKNIEALKDTLSEYDEDLLTAENERVFNEVLSENNKQTVLEALKMDKYVLNDTTFKDIDKFFARYKPLYMKLEDMYKDINFSKDLCRSLRQLMFSIYNRNSQISHGRFHDWVRLKQYSNINTREMEDIQREFLRIIMAIIISCRENGIVLTLESENTLIKITKKYYPHLYEESKN